jgi:hypothetical protein
MADAMRGAWVMEIDAKKKARIAALSEEMDGMHFVNSLYWQRGEAVTSEERAEYQRRLDRLDEIRREIAQLRSAWRGTELRQRGRRADGSTHPHSERWKRYCNAPLPHVQCPSLLVVKTHGSPSGPQKRAGEQYVQVDEG